MNGKYNAFIDWTFPKHNLNQILSKLYFILTSRSKFFMKPQKSKSKES